ncbi:hypothetical protein OG357_20440 [Streptomyces sp. NBC_01255]|uniref:hypothetical protein n=1 Tax=Streptomyces sp. NBC_01255 TaxID=2903798 RepID=UPI002E30BA11|nr:hypothetical protein [Streptomyces sp. NBC_01255]
MALFLTLIIVAMVLGIIGVTADGLLFLLFIGIAVFVAALTYAVKRTGLRSAHRRPVR